MSQPFWNPRQLRIARAASVAVVGMVLFGLVVATAMYPSWQLALATVCVAAIIPILWVGLGRQLAPLDPGTRAGVYLASAVPAIVGMVLFAVAAWLLSMAPTYAVSDGASGTGGSSGSLSPASSAVTCCTR